jgi:UDP-glucose 4-epimerase
MSFTPAHHAIHDAVKKFNITAVIHCAANSLVGPSVTTPAMYYENNVTSTLYMLDFLYAQGINKIVFSSSSSVYGDQEIVPIRETANLKPLTSYGRSKQMVEGILHDYSIAYDMRSVSLRYFNACGADFDGDIGQVKDATHVIARVIESIINNSIFSVYGGDYNTPDGTPIRDYTHVWDLALAHVQAVKYLEAAGDTKILNLGAGKGQSVKDILNATETVIGKLPIIEYGEARPGDPTRVIADISKAKEVLDWVPKYSDLNTIIDSAWVWYNSNTYRGLSNAK